MPIRLKNKSTVKRAKSGVNSLRTTIPERAIKHLKLKHNDVITWFVDSSKRGVVSLRKATK